MDPERVEGSNETEEIPTAPKRAMPNANVPEHIIICVDLCQLKDSAPFSYERIKSTPEFFNSLEMLKRIIHFFLHNKQAINPDSQYALLILRASGPVWLHNFTKDINEIILILNEMHSEECTEEEFDLSSIFNIIHKNINLPQLCADYKLIPPPNIVRLLLIYNRSECVPKFIDNDEIFKLLIKHPYFTTDILYAHEENCGEHKCKDIYDKLQALDNGYSYIFEVCKSAEKIHELSAKLLAHPFQRARQYDARYNFIE